MTLLGTPNLACTGPPETWEGTGEKERGREIEERERERKRERERYRIERKSWREGKLPTEVERNQKVLKVVKVRNLDLKH